MSPFIPPTPLPPTPRLHTHLLAWNTVVTAGGRAAIGCHEDESLVPGRVEARPRMPPQGCLFCAQATTAVL